MTSDFINTNPNLLLNNWLGVLALPLCIFFISILTTTINTYAFSFSLHSKIPLNYPAWGVVWSLFSAVAIGYVIDKIKNKYFTLFILGTFVTVLILTNFLLVNEASEHIVLLCLFLSLSLQLSLIIFSFSFINRYMSTQARNYAYYTNRFAAYLGSITPIFINTLLFYKQHSGDLFVGIASLLPLIAFLVIAFILCIVTGIGVSVSKPLQETSSLPLLSESHKESNYAQGLLYGGLISIAMVALTQVKYAYFIFGMPLALISKPISITLSSVAGTIAGILYLWVNKTPKTSTAVVPCVIGFILSLSYYLNPSLATSIPIIPLLIVAGGLLVFAIGLLDQHLRSYIHPRHSGIAYGVIMALNTLIISLAVVAKQL